jgi:CubicO group peptidase (beta-lactamase class C family)
MNSLKFFIHIVLLLIFFGFFSCTNIKSENIRIYPGEEWEEMSTVEADLEFVILDSALNYFNKNSGGAGTDEMVIVKGGRIIWKGSGAENYHEIYSCTKIFTSTALGILITEGKVGLNDLVIKHFPEIINGKEGQELYSKLTLKDLACMTGGYNGQTSNCWQLHLQGLHDESYACTQEYTIPDIPRFEPGTHFSYRDPEVHMLGYILTRVAGKSLKQLLKEQLTDKIGMAQWDWSDYGYRDGMFFNNPAGTPNDDEAKEMNEIQGGIWIRPVDFARLGLLYLNNGLWNGEQILDSVFSAAAFSNQVPAELPAVGLDLAGRYGLYWWTNGVGKNGTRPWPSAPPKTATAHGRGRNFCFVIPEWDMVIVRMSPRELSALPKHGDQIWEGFFKILKEGILKENLKSNI